LHIFSHLACPRPLFVAKRLLNGAFASFRAQPSRPLEMQDGMQMAGLGRGLQ
jgi:hypothetical protein